MPVRRRRGSARSPPPGSPTGGWERVRDAPYGSDRRDEVHEPRYRTSVRAPPSGWLCAPGVPTAEGPLADGHDTILPVAPTMDTTKIDDSLRAPPTTFSARYEMPPVRPPIDYPAVVDFPGAGGADSEGKAT